jgi:hypothetical protein
MTFERLDADYLLRVLDLPPELRERLEAFRAGTNFLSNEDRVDLRELVGERLLEVGFDKDYKPTPEGKRLEQLIDDLFTG